jgi:hypothetical protein
MCEHDRLIRDVEGFVVIGNVKGPSRIRRNSKGATTGVLLMRLCVGDLQYPP